MTSTRGLQLVTVILTLLIVIFLFFIKYQKENSIQERLEDLSSQWKQKESRWNDTLSSLRLETEMKIELANDPYHGSTLITENRLVFQNYTHSDSHAFVTMIGSASHVHSYWMGALAMIQSLREVKTRVPHIVVMIRLELLIPPFAIEAFHRLGAEIIYIDNLDMEKLNVVTPGTWAGAFDKLNVWSLIQFEKVVFLDADTLIVQNIDHLFSFPELTAPYTPTNCQCHADFVKSPQYFTISSGFFVCKPSLERFRQMVELASNPSPDPDDLAQFNGTWHWGDQQMLRVVFTQLSQSWNHLNWEYDLPVGMCSCPQRRTKPIYSYHFVCTYPIPKPWADPFVPLHSNGIQSCAREIYHLWYRLLSKALNTNEIDDAPPSEIQKEQGVAHPQNRVLWG